MLGDADVLTPACTCRHVCDNNGVTPRERLVYLLLVLAVVVALAAAAAWAMVEIHRIQPADPAPIDESTTHRPHSEMWA